MALMAQSLKNFHFIQGSNSNKNIFVVDWINNRACQVLLYLLTVFTADLNIGERKAISPYLIFVCSFHIQPSLELSLNRKRKT